MIFTKEWKLSDGMYDKVKLLTRINELNSNLNVRAVAPEHRFTLNDDRVICNYKLLHRARFVYATHNSSLIAFAERLDTLSLDDIPHGDIKYANCIWDGAKWLLIDWEPILEYKIQGGVLFRTTKPYISSIDLRSEVITSATDKLGFYFLVKRLRDGWINPITLNIYEVEMQIMDLSFQEILRLLNGSTQASKEDLYATKEKAVA